MKDIVFIIPYFGKFNNYFQLFLNSCKYNQNCDWLIFTDDKTQYNYPDNVIVHYITFDKLKEQIQAKFDFEIALSRPYKLCDYKIAYGYIFEEYIQEYKFWGHCDTDLIWGNISKFISGSDFDKYVKIGMYGHCTLYRNTKDINRVFMKDLNGKKRYRKVLTSDENHSFDEEFKDSINNIFEQYGYPLYYHEHQANIYTKSSDFRLTTLNSDRMSYSVEKKIPAFFVWNKGHLKRYYQEEGAVRSKEYMYIHMQSRPMMVKISSPNVQKYKIIPNVFEELEVNKIDNENFRNIKIKHFNLHYFRLRSKNLIDKVRKGLKMKKYHAVKEV